jgi:hypothetical protein
MTVELRQGHALDLIRDVPPGLHLIATDPPYAFDGHGAEHALGAVVANVLRESAYRLCKGGWAVIFAASSWRSTFYMVESMRGILEPVRLGTWAKPSSRTKVRTPGWAWASVNVVVLRKPGAPGLGGASELLDYVVAPPLINGRRAELPAVVAEWAVAPFAVPGGRMLDPFAGSGALCHAAALAGMDALGLDERPEMTQTAAPLPGLSRLPAVGVAPAGPAGNNAGN